MKNIILALTVTAFVLGASSAFAAKVKCTVDTVVGDIVTMTCKNADKLKTGDDVTVKEKKKKAIEGC